MPPLEVADHRQKVLYYEFVRRDRNGEPVVRSWVELDVRFTLRRREMTAPDGTPIVTDALVKTDRALEFGSVLWEGGEADLLGTAADPTTEQGPLYTVVTETRASDVKNRFTSRTYGLQRFRNTLPAVEDE